jgi:hypothetical protein
MIQQCEHKLHVAEDEVIVKTFLRKKDEMISSCWTYHKKLVICTRVACYRQGNEF